MTAPSFFERALGDEPPVRLADEDPDLFADLAPKGQLEARARVVVPVIGLERGAWPAELCGRCFGLLVLDGLLLHSAVVAQEPRSEIVGPGDVIRPWQDDARAASVPVESRWEVVQRARLAVLNNRFVAFGVRWPGLFSAVLERTVRRSHRLTLQLAIADVRRVDDRLILFFWHVADQWGRTSREGVVVPLPVTHDVLAQLVCAQRPTVTSALQRLTSQGRLRRRPDKSWLLAPQPPAATVAARTARRH